MRKEVEQDLRALASAVSAELGEGWSLDADQNWSAQVRGPASQMLSLSSGSYNDLTRVVIHGVFPRDHRGEYPYMRPADKAEISVASDRGAAVIAKEIRRRLLPTYEPALAALLARQADALSDYERRLTFGTHVIEAWGRGDQAEDGKGYDVWLRHGAVRLGSYPSSVDLQLTVSPEVALVVLRLVRDLETKERETS